MVLSSLYGLHQHVCMHGNVMADGVLECLDRDIPELLDSVRCNLVALDGPRGEHGGQ